MDQLKQILLALSLIASTTRVFGGDPFAGIPTVKTFTPESTDIQSYMDSLLLHSGNGSGDRWDHILPTAENNSSGVPALIPNNLKQDFSEWADHGQFPEKSEIPNVNRAILFKPGTYKNLNLYVGYYTSVIGLGKTPSETTIDFISCYMGSGKETSSICPGGGQGRKNPVASLNTFWRSIENFTTNPNSEGNLWWPIDAKGMTWAVSQGCPMRKVNVNGNLYLFGLANLEDPNGFPGGPSSGGFMADSRVRGKDPTENAVIMGSQQQFLVRNSTFVSESDDKAPIGNGVWNQVFVGCNGAPTSNCGNCPGQTNTPICPGLANGSGCIPKCPNATFGNPYTTVGTTPEIASKPYIYVTEEDEYFLARPKRQMNQVGPWIYSEENTDSIDFSNVFVAKPSDTASVITTQITSGKHVVFTPGLYDKLEGTIEVNTDKTVLLGIGFPILESDGFPCITVKAREVSVAGILFQAGGEVKPTSLLQWGTSQKDAMSGNLYDCFTRTGKFYSVPPSNTGVEKMVHVQSDGFIGDNLWLWRADHEYPNSETIVTNGDNPCQTGIQIDGDDVVMYGLAVEHSYDKDASTPSHQCIWNGNNGKCYFFQCEMPYDAMAGYSRETRGYKLGPNVKTHSAWGLGIYSFFRDHEISLEAAISTPNPSNGISFINPMIRYLAGYGGIESILINEETGETFGINTQTSMKGVTFDKPGPAYLNQYPDELGEGSTPYSRALP